MLRAVSIPNALIARTTSITNDDGSGGLVMKSVQELGIAVHPVSEWTRNAKGNCLNSDGRFIVVSLHSWNPRELLGLLGNVESSG